MNHQSIGPLNPAGIAAGVGAELGNIICLDMVWRRVILEYEAWTGILGVLSVSAQTTTLEVVRRASRDPRGERM